MQPAFNCLYHLENTECCIVEIKRINLPQDAELAEVFQWLIVDKQSGQSQRLNFRSMDSSGEVQERFFEQGYLKFNNENGTYIEKFNSGQHQLLNKSNEPLPALIIEILNNYLSN